MRKILAVFACVQVALGAILHTNVLPTYSRPTVRYSAPIAIQVPFSKPDAAALTTLPYAYEYFDYPDSTPSYAAEYGPINDSSLLSET